MKKQNVLKKSFLMLAATFMFAVIFSACKKSDVAHTPVAGLMAVNLVPDQDAIGVAIDNNAITRTPLLYTNYTGSYLGVYAGNRMLSSYLFNSGTVIGSSTEAFKDSAYYTLFVVGTQDKYQNIFVEDSLQSLSGNTGNAYVRYVNAVTGDNNSTISITSGSSAIFDDENKIGTVSPFEEATPGDIDIKVSNETDAYNAERSVNMAENGIYTVLLTGMPGATDTAQAVKIRIIQNGTVTP